jgi:hypothetical protein
MRRLIILAMAFLAMSAPAAAQFVAPGGAIPAVANIAGENDTFWRSDVSILNVSPAETSVMLYLYPELKNSTPTFDFQTAGPFSIPAGGQLTFRDVVTSVFELRNVKGGMQIFSDGAPLVLASRTATNAPEGGSYGLNVYGVLVVSETAWVANVEHDGFFRTNVGVFVPAGASPGNPVIFTVTINDAAGTEVASGSLTFDQAGLKQEDLEFFGVVDDLLDGSVTIRRSGPSVLWYAYATVIDNVTGDSVYHAAIGRQ